MQDISTSTLVGPTLVLGNDISPRVLRQSMSHLAIMAQFFVAGSLQTDDGTIFPRSSCAREVDRLLRTWHL